MADGVMKAGAGQNGLRIGWIGLGVMGLSTAKKIAAAGFDVTGFDIKPIAPEEAPGVRLAGSAREAVEGCDLLCVAVYSDDQVEELLTGPQGLFECLDDNVVVAVFTTGTIASARKLAAAAPPGIAVLDSCFSRRSDVFASGDMVLMVGGDAAALDRCRPAFAPFALEIHHVGASGAGRALKLVNNLLFYAQRWMADDALRLGESLGLDRQRAAAVLLKSTGASDAQNIFLRPDWREAIMFRREFMIKDVSAAAEAAREVGVDLGYLTAFVNACTAEAAKSA